MSYPILEHNYYDDKLNLSSKNNEFVTHNDLSHIKLAVMLFDSNLTNTMANKKISSLGGFKSGVDFHPYYIDNNILYVNSFLGGPNAAGLMEELSALGINNFLSVSGAGSISKDFVDCYLVVDTAIRDEGASYHYLNPSKLVSLDKKLIAEVVNYLATNDINYKIGKVWTTDSYYTEYEKLIEKRKSEGVKAIDMECATWAAVAKAKGLSFCEVLFCTDFHGNGNWKKLKNRNIKRANSTRFAINCAETIVKGL